MEKFRNRYEAGMILAEHLQDYAGGKNTIVLALPRGGVPVGYEIAKMLRLPLDVFIVRKLGVPGHEELAMGALAEGNVLVFNEEIINLTHISKENIEESIQSEQQELERRVKKYRSGKTLPDLCDKTIILVDDGVATGATIRVAINALRKQNPAKIIIAIPVADRSVCKQLEQLADEVICLIKAEYLHAVGLWYDNFSQTMDEEVIDLLKNQ